MVVRNIIKATALRSKKLSLEYSTCSTKFGNCLAAFLDDILCFLGFFDKEVPVNDLEKHFNGAIIKENPLVANKIMRIFEDDSYILDVYLKGSEFEIEVWEALLKIEKGKTVSYEDVAKAIGRPKALRAVGRAIGKNWIGYVVPCHRVISKNGAVHKYASGVRRKVLMLKDENAI